MSHGTTIIITFSADEDYSGLAKIAKDHYDRLPVIDGPEADRYVKETSLTAREYLQAIAEKKIYVPPARYPCPPITYSTVANRFNQEEFIELLIPFFKDVMRSDEKCTPNWSAGNVTVLTQYENAMTEFWELTIDWESHRQHGVSNLNVDDIQYIVRTGALPINIE